MKAALTEKNTVDVFQLTFYITVPVIITIKSVGCMVIKKEKKYIFSRDLQLFI